MEVILLIPIMITFYTRFLLPIYGYVTFVAILHRTLEAVPSSTNIFRQIRTSLIFVIFYSVVPDLVLPGLAGINAPYAIPSSAQLEELLKQGYPPQFVLQQLQLAQACIAITTVWYKFSPNRLLKLKITATP